MSPGDPDPAAKGAGQAVHCVAHGAAQLLPGGQTLDVAAVPHDPAGQRKQHQEGPAVYKQVSKVPSLDLQRSEDAQQQGDHAQQVHEHGKDQGQLAVGQTVVFRCHDWREQKHQAERHLLEFTLSGREGEKKFTITC